jgi:hypothetical protein
MSLFASIGMLIAFQGLSNFDRDETYAFCGTYFGHCPGEGSRLRGFRWRRRGTVGRNEASHARHKAACQCGPKMSDVIGSGRLCSRAATDMEPQRVQLREDNENSGPFFGSRVRARVKRGWLVH